MLINEFSTFFLNYRQFLLVFKRHEGRLYRWNALLFFAAFFVSRIVFNTVVSYYVGRAFYLTTKEVGVFGVPMWQFCIGIYLIILFGVFYILNLVWFTGILKHVKRSFGGGGRGNQEETEPIKQSQGQGGYETMKEPIGGVKKREGGADR